MHIYWKDGFWCVNVVRDDPINALDYCVFKSVLYNDVWRYVYGTRMMRLHRGIQ